MRIEWLHGGSLFHPCHPHCAIRAVAWLPAGSGTARRAAPTINRPRLGNTICRIAVHNAKLPSMNRVLQWIRQEHEAPQTSAPSAHRPSDRQGLRLFRHLLGALASLIAVASVYVHASSGLVPWPTAHAFAAMVALSVAAFTTAIASGFNRRFEDPSLTAAQMVTSGAVISYIAFAAPTMRAVLAPLYLLSLMFGAFRLSAQRQLGVSVCFVVFYAAAIALGGGVDELRDALPLVVNLALYLGMMSVVGGYVSNLRDRLRSANAELTKAFEKIERIATFDELTGLYNRRSIREIALRERKRANRSGATLCIALADADHFKRINDLYGHATGDEVLRALGRTLLASLRETEYVGRYGGEEFLLVLPETPKERARVPLERLRQGIAGIRVEGLPAEERLAVSIGVAVVRPGEDIFDTIKRADAALYEAKRAGRDRIVWDRG
jgi:diguanylate cyclase (GGDEF)-like protein